MRTRKKRKQVFLFERETTMEPRNGKCSEGEKEDPTIICETQAREAIAREPGKQRTETETAKKGVQARKSIR